MNMSEKSGKYYMGKNLILPTNELQKEIENEKDRKAAEEANKLLIELEKQKQDEINQKLETLEMLPMGNKIILMAYPENPYKKIMEGSIIVNYSGDFLNPDTGEKDKLKELVGCAKIIEIGPDCKYLKPGDDVYYDTRTTYPVPFMSLGYQLTTEPQILCIMNEGLKDRFNMNK